MKSWGYIVALSIGLLIGWLGQQFWAVDLDQEATSQAELVRSSERLKRISSQTISSLAQTEPNLTSVVEASTFQDLMLNEGTDAAYRWLSAQETEFARYFTNLKSLVDELFRRERFPEIIDILYEQSLAIPFEQEEAFKSYIYETVDRIESFLQDQRLLTEIVSLFQQLVSLEPDRAPYVLSLINWLIQTKDLDQAEELLSIVRNNIEYSSAAEELALRIDDLREIEDGDVASIPLEQKGKHYIVSVDVGSGQSLELLLDTGATLTVVKNSIGTELGLRDLEGESLKMTTANGQVEGYKVTVPEISFPGVQLNDVDVGLMPLPGFEFDGLLGMNVLGRFKFFIDQDQQRLLLKK